ncbi:MAG: AraC family transcriptional regulator [Desulfobacterales bacterium]|nr:AraC family transcriptional regulator [Desulfobacterales bacterium]
MMYPANKASLSLILWNILKLYGIDPEPLFQEMALNPGLMRKPGGRYPIDSMDKLWRKASEVIGDPCFGLKAAEVWHPSNFGALGYAMLASNTLRTSLERLVRYLGFLSDEDFMKLDDTEEGLRLTLVLSHRSIDKSEQNDAVLAVTLRMCRINYVEDLAPVSVTLVHPKSSCSPKYFEYFRSPVLFEASTYSFTLPIQAVDKILPGSNPQLAKLNDQVMIEYLAKLDQDHIVQKVKAAIIDQLPSGSVTDETVAQKLYMSSRKLQRHLQKAGTTFNALLNEVRLDLAQKYLTEEHNSITEIAFLLGFSESSAFSRAFKRWMGVSPATYRKAA